MFVQSATGLLVRDAYRDAPWFRSAWFGNDLVTLGVATPLLVGALVLARRGSRRARLVWMGMLGYSVYNTAFYLFGAALNVFFPLYVALFVLSVAALVSAGARFPMDQLPTWFSRRTPHRLVGGWLAFLGFGLGMAWSAQWLAFVAVERAPPIGTEAFRLIAALDLSSMVPCLGVGGVLLWRRRAWGYLLSAIAGVQGAVYLLGLTVSSVVASQNGLGATSEIPVWAGAAIATTVAIGLLLAGIDEEPG